MTLTSSAAEAAPAIPAGAVLIPACMVASLDDAVQLLLEAGGDWKAWQHAFHNRELLQRLRELHMLTFGARVRAERAAKRVAA